MMVGTIAWATAETLFHCPAPYLTSIGLSLATYVALAILARISWPVSIR
jgi:hypothetical protein